MNKLIKDTERLRTKRVLEASFSERDGRRLRAVLKGIQESAFGS